MAYVPNSGSVVAFQGTVPFSVLGNIAGSVVAFQGGAPWANTNVGSVISVNQGSVATVIIGGSIAASFTPPANQSVSGTVQTDVRGSVATVIIGGSIAASFTPPANQSVSGTVSVGNFPTTQNVSGSVAALVTNTVTVVSSLAGGIFPVSGSVSAVVTNFPTTQNVSGSVVSFQGGAPWAQTNVGSIITITQSSVAVAIVSGSIAVSVTPPANQSVSGTVQTDVRGSVATVIIGGSIAASFTPPANQSVSGTVTVNQGTAPWVQTGSVQGTVSVLGTVPVTQSGAWTHSVIGTYSDSTVSSTVTGIPVMFKANVSSSIMQAVSPAFPLPVSVQGVLQISGNPSISGTVNIAGNPSISGTVLVNNGSVVSFQGGAWTASIVAATPLQVVSSLAGGIFPISGSVAAAITNTNVNVSGSVTATQVGMWKTSIASNYAAGAASVISAIGNLAFGVRNDTLASVLATSDGQYIPWTVGPAGENITANAPLNKWVQGTTSVLNQFGASMATIAAQGTSIFTYITSGQVANMSGSSVLITFSGATSSVIGYTIAPPGGGSNMVIPNAWKSNANGAITASVSGAASVYISLQGFISKT